MFKSLTERHCTIITWSFLIIQSVSFTSAAFMSLRIKYFCSRKKSNVSLNKKAIFVFHTIFKIDYIMQIIYCIIHRCLCSHFILFCSVISVSKKWNIQTMLTFPYSYSWIKMMKIQNEWKKKLGVSEYGPWICNWANQ